MKKIVYFFNFATLVLCVVQKAASADMEAYTKNGKAVILKDDGTWVYNNSASLVIAEKFQTLDTERSIIEVRFRNGIKEREAQRQIEDAQFRRGLVGQSRLSVMKAEESRIKIELQRKTEDIITEYRITLSKGADSIDIPTYLSPEMSMDLKERINTLVSGIYNKEVTFAIVKTSKGNFDSDAQSKVQEFADWYKSESRKIIDIQHEYKKIYIKSE